MNAYNNFLLSIVVVMVSGAFSAIQYQKCNPDWNGVGCKIDYHRNLTILIDDRKPNAAVKIDWDNLNGYVHDLSCRCRDKADGAGYKWFVLEKSGLCLSAAGTLADYNKIHPLDDASRCTGQITITSSNAPDGSQCVLGVYRGYFYTVKPKTQPQSAPVQSGEEQVAEEEVAHNPAPAPEEEVAANPAKNPEEEVKACKHAADVILVLDLSGSVREDLDFPIEKSFALKFLERFDLSTSRIGIITYDSQVRSNLTWSQSSKMNLDQLKGYVNNIKYTGGSTVTPRALTYARTHFIEPERRSNINPTIIIMTDGVSRDDAGLVSVSGILRNTYKCKIIAIGIGSYDPDQLEVMTNKDKSLIITKESFNSLGKDMGVVLNQLIQKTCV